MRIVTFLITLAVLSTFVYAQAEPDTSLSATPSMGNAPMDVVFTALCRGMVRTCVIDFGDGTLALVSTSGAPQIIIHNYDTPGNFIARLTAVDVNGNEDPTPASVSIAVTDINHRPNILLRAEPVTGRSPLTVSFVAQCSDKDGAIESCKIDFGDGTSEVLQNHQAPQSIKHTYTTSVFRVFVAVLNAVDDDGAESLYATQTIRVTSRGNRLPRANLAVFPAVGDSPLDVVFIAKCSDEDGTISECELDFGDGSVDDLDTDEIPESVTHQYVNFGDTPILIPATLKARDNDGGVDTQSVFIKIMPGLFEPQTLLSANITKGNSPLRVIFDARCTDSDGFVTLCRLDFGDGTTQFLTPIRRTQQVVHTYRNFGSDPITAIATLHALDDTGVADSTPAAITFFINPEITSFNEELPKNQPQVREKSFEFTVDVRDKIVEKEVEIPDKRVLNGLLFGSNEIKITLPEGKVKEIKFNVGKTNKLGYLIVLLGNEEIYKDKANEGKHILTFERNIAKDTVLTIKTTSSGWQIWAPSTYDVSGSVLMDTQEFIENKFDFVVNDNYLLDFIGAVIDNDLTNVDVSVNNVPVRNVLDKDVFRVGRNTLIVTPRQNTQTVERFVLRIAYHEEQAAGYVFY